MAKLKVSNQQKYAKITMRWFNKANYSLVMPKTNCTATGLHSAGSSNAAFLVSGLTAFITSIIFIMLSSSTNQYQHA